MAVRVLGSAVGPVLAMGTVTDCRALIRWRSRDGSTCSSLQGPH